MTATMVFPERPLSCSWVNFVLQPNPRATAPWPARPPAEDSLGIHTGSVGPNTKITDKGAAVVCCRNIG